MENKAIKKINTAGTVGYVVCILLIIAAIASMVGVAIGTAGAIVTAPEKIGVSVSTDISLNSEGDFFDKMSHFIKIDGVENLADLISEDGEVFKPDNRDVSEISVKKQGNGLALNAKLGERTFSTGRIIFALVVTFCYLAVVTVALYILKALMKALKECASPFEDVVVKRMSTFAAWLIPTAVMHVFTVSAWNSLGGDSSFGFTVNLGVVLLAALVFILVSVFKYGAQLQKESDETL